MSNKVKTIWTVTYDLGGANQRILVQPDWFLEDELELGGEQATDQGDYLDSLDQTPLPRGNVRRDVTLSVIRSHASPAAVREFIFATDLTIPVGISADLHFQITGGAHYKLADSVFKSWRTSPRRPGTNLTTTVYRLECGALSLVP